MLMEEYRQHYEGIRQLIDQLQAIADRHGNVSEFQTVFLKVEQTESRLADRDEDLGALGAKAQSYQTEINKQLRLLKVDLIFLKAARQAATSEQRWAIMGDRLHLLISYCDTLLSQDF
jgi:ABC-type transporter Mla subunit MlaD